MPNRLPSNLYTGGAVVFNSRAYSQFHIQLLARKKAQDDSLDEYYRNFGKSINPAGVREQDLSEMNAKINEWREFYLKNTNAIKNPRSDDGKAQTEFFSRYQDALNYIQQSKGEVEKVKPFLNILADPDKSKRVPPKARLDLQLHELPLNDPNRKSFDITKIDFEEKPLDISTLINEFSDIKMQEKETFGALDPQNLTRQKTKEYSFGKEAKGSIYERASLLYSTNPSFKKTIEQLSTNPENYTELSTIFKKNYGEEIETPEDAAAAFMLKILPQQRVEQSIEQDTYERQKAMQAIRQRDRVNISIGGGSNNIDLRDIYKEVKELTASNNKITRGEGAPLNELSATAQSIILKYANDLTKEGLTQADIFLNQDANGTINIRRTSDQKIIAPIDFKDINVPAQPSVKEKREVIKQGNKKKKADPLGIF